MRQTALGQQEVGPGGQHHFYEVQEECCCGKGGPRTAARYIKRIPTATTIEQCTIKQSKKEEILKGMGASVEPISHRSTHRPYGSDRQAYTVITGKPHSVPAPEKLASPYATNRLVSKFNIQNQISVAQISVGRFGASAS